MGTEDNNTIKVNGEETAHFDDSPGYGEGEMEVDLEDAQGIIDVPRRLKRVEQTINSMASSLETMANSMSILVQVQKKAFGIKSKPPGTSPKKEGTDPAASLYG